MAGLTVQNFLSADTGIAVAFALIRAFARQGLKTLGNAWIDIARITLYLLLPLAIIFALYSTYFKMHPPTQQKTRIVSPFLGLAVHLEVY